MYTCKNIAIGNIAKYSLLRLLGGDAIARKLIQVVSILYNHVKQEIVFPIFVIKARK